MTTLYQRLALSIVASFAIVLSLFYWWTQHLQSVSYDEAEQRLHIELAQHLASDNPLLSQGVFDYEALQNLFHTLMILGPGFEFYFVDPEGNILTYSADPGKVVRQQVDLTPLKQLLSNPEVLPIYGDDPRNADGQKVFSVSAVHNQDVLQGYLYVIIGGEIYDHVLARINANNQLWSTAVIIIVVLALLLFVLLGLFRSFTSPLMRLTREMEQVKQVNFDTNKVVLSQWPEDKDNEIHQLGHTFQLMVTQINQQFIALQSIDRQRRELLADLSHDLRTPLASLQGYIETILIKGDALDARQREQYIQVIFKNASAIRKLIDQIFELAYLEGGQVAVNMEVFPLVELLYDVVEKFKLKAEKKGIKLNINADASETMVYTDIAKLERVLSNLLDNALRHTNEGGRIDLELGAASGQVEVQIRDTGSGIKAQDIAYIFDARYRASNAVDSKSTHAGLGLAITKKLLNLLKTDISVSSEIGVGTCFSFLLEAVAEPQNAAVI